jgi:hypothetical protein
MALLPETEQKTELQRADFNAAGELQSAADEVAMVKQAWQEAQTYLGNEASYKLEWSAADTVYRSPRPFSFWEGSYVLEPNLRRFDVAKWTNSVTAQVMQALFSEDPPFTINPGPKMKLDSARAWEVLIARKMKEAGPGGGAKKSLPALPTGFKEEFNLLVEQWGLKGTGVAMYYVQEEEICTERRKSSKVQMPAGQASPGHAGMKLGPPEIEKKYKLHKSMKFEFIDLAAEDCVVWDPKAKGGDIRRAKWTVRRRLLDFYDLQALALDPNYDIPGAVPEGLTRAEVVDDQLQWEQRDTGEEVIVAGSLIDLFFGPAETDDIQSPPMAAQIQNGLRGILHQAQSEQTTAAVANPLRRKLEVLEYLDQQNNHVITVLNGQTRIRSGRADFGYLSANYWNLPNAMLGLGIGQIGSNNQQLAQWIVNSALKVLAISLNAPHLAPDTIGQSPRVIKIGAGKVLTVTEQAFSAGGMKLLETAKVDPTIWPVLQEATKEGESATGADALLVQGSSAGPRAGMGRTAGGAGIMASKSDARLDGPMSHLVDQIFLPFIGAIVWFIFHHMEDKEILDILGEELGPGFVYGQDADPEKGIEAKDALDLENFHNEEFGYDVLIGAKLGALRNLAQSLVLMFEYGMNPEMQQFLADVHGTTIDVQTIYKLLLLASHCGTGTATQIIRKLTPQEMKRNQQKQQMAAQMGPGGKVALQDNQAQHDQALQEQKDNARLIEKIVVGTGLKDALPMAEEGSPGASGLGDNE